MEEGLVAAVAQEGDTDIGDRRREVLGDRLEG